jgi:hypothetical protein
VISRFSFLLYIQRLHKIVEEVTRIIEKELLLVVLVMTTGSLPFFQQIAKSDIDTTLGAAGYFDQGYAQGRNDRLIGNAYNDYCDPHNNADNPNGACATFKAGYAAGWTAAGLIYGNQGSQG